MSTSTQRTASVEVGVPRAEQDHRQRGARAQLGAEMRDTTRLVGGRAVGPDQPRRPRFSLLESAWDGERVYGGGWCNERSWRSGLSHDQGSVAGARTDGQRVIASHVCYSNRTNSRGDSLPGWTERLEPTTDSRSNVFSTSSFSPHNGFSPGQTNIT